ncbi:MAG: GNAT family N-acetyltransferase [Proteobacteria bacterium]|nr:GNAT family N-acetyltransferase [Pseudomonadota bacterium]
MTEAEFDAFVACSVPEYAAGKVRAGNWSEDEAPQRADDEFRNFLPQGLATPGHHLYTVRDGTREVGTLWLGEIPGRQRAAFVYDIRIDTAARGRGYGEATMRAAEAEARRLGLTEIKLHVFADNHAARTLYEKLGYIVTNLNMSKPLE